MVKIIICIGCGKESEHRAKRCCSKCYREIIVKNRKSICPRCKRLRPIHAKGYCNGCYNSVFRLEQAKDYNYQKTHNISAELYREITQKCVICGFDKIVDLHHKDENKKNNSRENMIGLCPNHHKMIHMLKYKEEMKEKVRLKTYSSNKISLAHSSFH